MLLIIMVQVLLTKGMNLMPSIGKTIKAELAKSKLAKKKLPPPWAGPQKDGVTQSLLNDYLFCRERFRIRVIDGLTVDEGFNARMEYGSMWHECEEVWAAGGSQNDWEDRLAKYSGKLIKAHRLEQADISKWMNICKHQFPIYVEFWKKSTHVKNRTPLLQEHTFKVPYKLPSGRTVFLRGKMDSVDLVKSGKKKFIWLQENKTKGQFDEESIVRRLQFDLQTLLYQTALDVVAKEHGWKEQIKGVCYNVIRRPLSGGKFSYRPHQATAKKPAEKMSDYYARVGQAIKENPEHFFARWNAIITKGDIKKFQTQLLNPLLETLCDDYEWWDYCHHTSDDVYDYTLRGSCFPNQTPTHYRLPYGLWHPIAEGRDTGFDKYLDSGDSSGLVRVDSLFGEL